MRWAPVVLASTISLTSAGLLRADPVAPEAQGGPSNTIAETESYYAPWILGSDVTALVLIGGGFAARRPLVVASGIGLYIAAPPVVHGIHHNFRGVALSVAARTGIPLAFGVLVAALTRKSHCPVGEDHPDREYCQAMPERFAIGAGVGALGAIAVDAVFLARRPVGKPSSFAITPSASWSETGGWKLGVQGRF
jgi:hypothetical protein